MRQDYYKMREILLPDVKKQDEMWKMIINKAGENQKKRRRCRAAGLACTAAVLLVFAFCLPQTGLAGKMNGFLQKHFFKNADVSHDIAQNIYEDSDGHIKMQVQEMLTDGSCVYMDICYEALDEEGERWLSEKEFDMAGSIFFCTSEADTQSTNGWSESIIEHEEQATDRARYFTFLYEDISGNFNMKDTTRTLIYPMYKNLMAHGDINLSSSIDTVSYRLEGDGSPSRYYEPKYLVVSELSYGIFGKNLGAYTRTENTEKLHYDDIDDVSVDITFIMKDGSSIDDDRFGGSHAGYSPAANVPGFDFKVAAGSFWEESEGIQLIKPDELAALDINGIHYELILDELPK